MSGCPECGASWERPGPLDKPFKRQHCPSCYKEKARRLRVAGDILWQSRMRKVAELERKWAAMTPAEREAQVARDAELWV